MTTAQSPASKIQAQADRIAKIIKAAERGEPIEARFAAKMFVARAQPAFKFAVVMDDKIFSIEMPWTTIRETSEPGLAEYIAKQMRDDRSGH